MLIVHCILYCHPCCRCVYNFFFNDIGILSLKNIVPPTHLLTYLSTYPPIYLPTPYLPTYLPACLIPPHFTQLGDVNSPTITVYFTGRTLHITLLVVAFPCPSLHHISLSFTTIRWSPIPPHAPLGLSSQSTFLSVKY